AHLAPLHRCPLAQDPRDRAGFGADDYSSGFALASSRFRLLVPGAVPEPHGVQGGLSYHGIIFLPEVFARCDRGGALVPCSFLVRRLAILPSRPAAHGCGYACNGLWSCGSHARSGVDDLLRSAPDLAL